MGYIPGTGQRGHAAVAARRARKINLMPTRHRAGRAVEQANLKRFAELFGN